MIQAFFVPTMISRRPKMHSKGLGVLKRQSDASWNVVMAWPE
jgi:hypothetical protein